MMNRRNFIKTISTAGLGAGFLGFRPLYSLAGGIISKRLVILHTNDTHARIDPFPDGSRYEGLGGVARRASLIKTLRSSSPDITMLLDAGDVFQGTPYFNYYGGALDFRIMSEMGYDAGTIGNHEFDNGVDGFAKVAGEAAFPFISSNYDFGDSQMAPFVRPNLVKSIDGIKVGIFGLGIDFENLVLPHLHQGVTYLDPVRKSKQMVQVLRRGYDCDVIICLSHLGYDYSDGRISDRIIAEQVDGIDLIIGGHTHTFLDEPEIFDKQNSRPVIITQVGFAGMILGSITFEFDRNNRVRNTYAANTSIDPSIAEG
jgi:5'-nucleotidase